MKSFKSQRGESLPELLSPAGSPEALYAAIEAGADAVYFGFSSFSNRMRARNFDEEELYEAVKLCSLYGVKSYVTLNTRVFDRELEDIKRICRMDGIKNADALIVADLGVAEIVRELLPDVALHASTQATGVTPADGAVLKRLGFERMVCPRETSFEALCELVKKSPVEIETFIHGAHCVSFSGQCLMSFAMGGRSPNRGECAQPCRLPYLIERGVGSRDGYKNTRDFAGRKNGRRIDGSAASRLSERDYPLSLKDMCLAGHIPEIIESGVASLKIEGRLKSAEYVYGVTRIYRRLLDERRRADRTEIKELENLFSRSGFTDGYFTGNYTNMLGIRGESRARADLAVGEIRLTKKIPLKISASIKRGLPSRVSMSDGKKSVEFFADIPDEAKTRPIDSDVIIRSISRLGNTPFTVRSEDIEIDVDDGLWMTAAELNKLRRGGVDALTAALTDKGRKGLGCGRARKPDEADARVARYDLLKGVCSPLRFAEFSDLSQVTKAALLYFDRIYLPSFALESMFSDGMDEFLSNRGIVGDDGELDKIRGKFGFKADAVSFDDKKFEKMARNLFDRGIRSALVNTLSELDIAKLVGFDVAASMRFNASNTPAARELYKIGADYVTASPEVSLKSLCRMEVPAGAVIYGKLPLMLTSKCIVGHNLCAGSEKSSVKSVGHTARFGASPASCKINKEKSVVYLRDRKGARFPIAAAPGCMSVVYNAYPIWMADKMEELDKAGLLFHHYIFATESAEKVDEVVFSYRERDRRVPDNIKRI